MKRTCMFLILAAITALLTLPVHAQCSNATLTGSYPFIYNGQNAPGHRRPIFPAILRFRAIPHVQMLFIVSIKNCDWTGPKPRR